MLFVNHCDTQARNSEVSIMDSRYRVLMDVVTDIERNVNDAKLLQNGACFRD